MADAVLPNGARLAWDTRSYEAAFVAEMERRIRLAAEVVKAYAQRNLSASSRASGPSKPGEFPHADTGRLRQSVFVQADGLEAIVGTDLPVGLFLEYGTAGGVIVRAKAGKALSWVGPDGKRRFARWVRLGRIEPRPWLRRSLDECRPRIRAIIEKPWDGGSPSGALAVEYRGAA